MNHYPEIEVRLNSFKERKPSSVIFKTTAFILGHKSADAVFPPLAKPITKASKTLRPTKNFPMKSGAP